MKTMKDLVSKKEELKKTSKNLITVLNLSGEGLAETFIEQVNKAQENQWCERCLTHGSNVKVDVTGLKNCPRCGSRIVQKKEE